MKIIKLLVTLISLSCFLSCQEESHKPLFEGGVPDKITQYKIENLSGAAAISFKIDDPRTVYVKAVYTLKEGLTRSAKASKYDNVLMIDGFSEVKDYTVAIYAVSADEQQSEPTYVTVHPSTPPFQKVVHELLVNPDWGGGKILGDNMTSSQLMIGVLKKNNTTNTWEEVELFFTEGKSFSFNFRGLKPVETQFGIFVRDKWQNYSDTMTFVFEPWEEIKLPLTHQNFNQIVLPGDAAGQAAYGLRRLFDGLKFSWADGYYSTATEPFPKVITIDLLAKYQLSRWKYFQNGNLYYQSANAKHMRIWGNNTLDTDYSKWKLLGEWDDWRPSKRPPTTGNSGLTDEDLAKAQAGNDFDFPLGIEGVRYIRIETLSTWEPRTQVYFPEIEFWGRRVD